ncbi:NADPH-dependent FMN reductase [Streptomyces beijiangensis]|uniref:NAD(P)H-dependent oxidoreductase n=1 Tax=Streptomyces beijiangensis TaxID=163361 RepID=A0A939JK96_9ACTN|nr:NADPH-dependent FMN reductase [Streptomyces beijiangensis]MBO0517398.1 NAD(P)H-dependent oxidoreductase [Streptomyces beijiangensis]
MQLLTLSGSLRTRSTNGFLLHAARLMATADGAEVTTAEIGTLPHFNPDLDGEGATVPAPVAALREAVGAADAVLVVSPEYAHGVPGTLKNALDWLVSSGEFVSRRVGVITASPSSTGGDYANAQLCETLRMMTGTVVEEACLTVGLIGGKLDRETGEITDDQLTSELRAAVKSLTTPS